MAGRCGCLGLRGLELARCLAPPPGDHEVVLEGLAGSQVVVNEEGFWLRAAVRDEWLPFLSAVERRAGPEAVESALRRMGVGVEELVCMAAGALLEAAAGGSARAAEKLAACRGLVEEVLSKCGGGRAAPRGRSSPL